ncbi:MAG: helix-turn-helix transcriptional regulator [Thiobacillaceae bacterium]
MTKTQEILEIVRTKLNGATDYKIAQVLDIPRQRISEYANGKQQADSYTCAKIAEILERDPLEIIAQVEAEAARTEKKRKYWRSFFSGLRQAPHVVALCGILGITGHVWQDGAGAGETSHNVY